MWNVDGDLLQIEVGSNVVSMFTEKDKRGIINKFFGQAPPPQAQLLIEYTKKIREVLAEKDVYLPPIKYFDSTELNVNDFKIYIGIEYYEGDITKVNLFDILDFLIQRYQIDNKTNKGIKKIFDQGVNNLIARNYQNAVLNFSKVYYWSSLIDNCEQDLVKATLNIAGIELLNYRLENAELSAQRACVIVSKDYFHDPYLRCYSYNFRANILAKQNRINEAMNYYKMAYDSIKNTNDVHLSVNVLFNLATMNLFVQRYHEAADIIDHIVQAIKNNDTFGKGVIADLYEFRVYLSNLTLVSLEDKYQGLLKQYQDLSKNFILKAYDSALAVIVGVGPYVVSALVGALLSGDVNNTFSQTSNSGTNTIYLK